MRQFIVSVVVVLLASVAASAQPLSERVPDSALFYFGWRGSDTLDKAYDDSHLAAVVKASNLSGIFDQTIPQLVAKIQQDEPEAAATLQASIPLIKQMWKRPTAVFIESGKDSRGDWEPKFVAICDVGADAAAFQKSLAGMVAQMGKTKTPVLTALDGTFVIFSVGYEDAVAATKPKASLHDSKAFANAMKQVHADPVYITMMDLQGVVRSIDDSFARGHDKDEAASWPKVRESLGVAGLKMYVGTGAFEGKDWSFRSFIEAPTPRAGLVGLLTDKSPDPATLKLIPPTASYAMVHQLDSGKVFQEIRKAVASGSPEAAGEFDQGLAKVTKAIGVDLKSLFESLGDQWAVYTDGGVAGAGPEGTILVNPLHDAAKVDDSFIKLFAAADKFTRQAPNPQMQMRAGELQVADGLNVHYLDMQGKRFSWIVKDGHLYVGLAPKGVGAATLVSAQPTAAAGGFATNEKFKAIQARLEAPASITGFEFADLPQTAQQQYMGVGMVLGMVNMMGFSSGVMLPPNLLPPIEVIKANVAPSGGVSWVDDAGWHSRSISPFPGSFVFASEQMDTVGVGGAALLTSILLPSLNRARETANRVKCASNERQIGTAVLLYSNDNRGKYPPDMGAMIKTQDITPEVFVCPSSDNSVPADIKNAPKDKQAAWVNANASYVYVGGGMRNTAGPNDIVLYEKKDNHNADGINILWGDGHVSWEAWPAAEKLIADDAAAKVVKANELKR
jgi:prepilin-type processing-associated H-X9-DG protein